ncbi:hypothetical protein ACFSJ3_11280 [Corallincola platygyrae]|uniref:Zinc-regulated TonB-dependent outer membrane receptor n=1 Tax=Corallincola platygyrae TaxID=1193278 RepID=A0ABW4XQ10_9GAMM
MKKHAISVAVACAIFGAAAPVYAQTGQSGFNPNISAVINVGYTDRSDFEGIGNLPIDEEHAGGPDEGFWVDHTELALSAAFDDMFYGKVTTVLAEHDDETEVELEEAFVQTMGMPYGLSVRGGRFLSNIGYLNSKHMHTDSFVDRPLVYRAFVGSHYYDDGVRLNWVAPTDTYIELGVEGFKGGQFPAAADSSIGATNLYAKFGGDIGDSQSWQAGLAWLSTEHVFGECGTHDHGHDDEHDHEDHDEHEEDHHDEEHHDEDHHEFEFGACDFDGDKDFYIADFVWKWAPGGNYKYQSLTLQGEYFYVDEDGWYGHEHEGEYEQELRHDDSNSGWYVSGVYRWSPNWSAGVRYSEIDPADVYSEGYKPKATDLMLDWNYSHFATVRVQYTRDESMEDLEDDIFSIQFVGTLGAHGAHLY